jgi:flagellar protein FlaG
MNNNINSAPINADNGFMPQTSAGLDSTKDNKLTLSADKKASVENLKEVKEVKEVERSATVDEVSAKQEKEVSENDINKALEVVSSFMNSSNKQIAFSNDNTSGKTVITITDKKTQEVINQFPSDKIISMAERIQDLHREAESISGLLIDSRV